MLGDVCPQARRLSSQGLERNQRGGEGSERERAGGIQMEDEFRVGLAQEVLSKGC